MNPFIMVEVTNPETPFGGVQILEGDLSFGGGQGPIGPEGPTGPQGPAGPAGGTGTITTHLSALVEGQDYVEVTFDTEQTDNGWIFVECAVLNLTDSTPLNIWPGIITSKTSTGFRRQLNVAPDSENYFLSWAVTGETGDEPDVPTTGEARITSSGDTRVTTSGDTRVTTGTVTTTSERVTTLGDLRVIDSGEIRRTT